MHAHVVPFAPQDASLWQLIAYCAGTGGSLLIIGSAAGVAFMGMQKDAGFGWYARRITPWATAGYLAGIATYALQQQAGAALPLLLAGAGGGVGGEGAAGSGTAVAVAAAAGAATQQLLVVQGG